MHEIIMVQQHTIDLYLFFRSLLASSIYSFSKALQGEHCGLADSVIWPLTFAEERPLQGLF
jgi:hypothetical protein